MTKKAKITVTVEYETDMAMLTDEIEELLRRCIRIPLKIVSPKIEGTIRLEHVKTDVKL